MKHNAKHKSSRRGTARGRNGKAGNKRNPDVAHPAAPASNVATYLYDPPSESSAVPMYDCCRN